MPAKRRRHRDRHTHAALADILATGHWMPWWTGEKLRDKRGIECRNRGTDPPAKLDALLREAFAEVDPAAYPWAQRRYGGGNAS